MKKKDEIMSSKELRDIFVSYVAQNRVLLESALDKYDDAWYDIRNQMAENGMELTPDELQELTGLIRYCLKLLDGKSKQCLTLPLNIAPDAIASQNKEL